MQAVGSRCATCKLMQVGTKTIRLLVYITIDITIFFVVDQARWIDSVNLLVHTQLNNKMEFLFTLFNYLHLHKLVVLILVLFMQELN